MTDRRTNVKPRRCPACGHRFIPWGAWRISRWSAITCPSCKTPLTRTYDIQFGRLFFFSFIGIMLLSNVAYYFELTDESHEWWAFHGGILMVLYLIDTFTLRLQLAGEYRRFWGYKI